MQIFYTFIIACFFSGVLYYLTNYGLLPYNSDKVLDIKNVVIVSVVLVLMIASIFSFFHLILDKLFFRKFYEKPRVLPAARRGFFLGLSLTGLAWLRIFGFWELHIIILVLVLILLFEAFFLSISSGSHQGSEVRKDRKEEEEQ